MLRRTSDPVRYTTGQIARRLGISREQLLRDLLTLELDPDRDALGYRVLTEAQVQALERLRADRARRRHSS